MQQWKTLSRKTILDHNKFLKVEQHVVELPDGKIINDWAWIVTPDYVLILPMTPDGKFLCFRQVKYAITGTSLAPVGGHVEPGEDPFLAAKRELREEMGCESDEWIHLGDHRVNGNNGCGTGHLYLAKNIRRVATPIIDDLEEMIEVVLTIEELENALLAGEIKVMSWVAVTAMALLKLKRIQFSNF